MALTPAPGPLGRAALVAKANAICAAGLAADRANGDGYAQLATDARTRNELRQLRPTAAIAQDWHRVVAGLVADHELTFATTPPPDGALLRRKDRKGEALRAKLGIDCYLI